MKYFKLLTTLSLILYFSGITAQIKPSKVISIKQEIKLTDIVKFPPRENLPKKKKCCPPWNAETIIKNTKIRTNPNGGLDANYTVWFNPTQQLKNQMQAYLNYVNAIKPDINSIIINWQLRESDKDCKKFGAKATNESFTHWNAPGNGNITGGNFWGGYPLEVGKHYLLHTGIFFNGDKKFFDKECSVNQACIYISVTPKIGKPTIEITVNGKTYKKELSSNSFKSTPLKREIKKVNNINKAKQKRVIKRY